MFWSVCIVAYSDDSDIGSDSEETEKPLDSSASKEFKDEIRVDDVNVRGLCVVESNSVNSQVPHNTDSTSHGVNSIVDDDDDINLETKSCGLLSSIPAAKPLPVAGHGLNLGEEDELTDVPTVDTWNITQQLKKHRNDINIVSPMPVKSATDSISKSKKKRKVQFFVPALSEFAEEDEETEQQEPECKKLKPSSSGTGLFSLLPEPKHITIKEAKRSLVPHVLTKKTVPVQKSSKPKFEPKNSIANSGNDSEEDEGNEGSSDFFSLSESASDIDLKTVPAGIVSASDVGSISKKLAVSQIVEEHKSLSQKVTVYSDDYSNNSQYSSTQSQETEVLYPSQQTEPSPEGHAGIDEETMLRLAGKRRGKVEAINFINVNADDALLTRDEWMTKALSEEKPTHSFSKKRDGLPSQKQKQKHQITYLAHQAKERELELKNNWAQNRMTKMQTQAKYGF